MRNHDLISYKHKITYKTNKIIFFNILWFSFPHIERICENYPNIKWKFLCWIIFFIKKHPHMCLLFVLFGLWDRWMDDNIKHKYQKKYMRILTFCVFFSTKKKNFFDRLKKILDFWDAKLCYEHKLLSMYELWSYWKMMEHYIFLKKIYHKVQHKTHNTLIKFSSKLNFP